MSDRLPALDYLHADVPLGLTLQEWSALRRPAPRPPSVRHRIARALSGWRLW